MSSYTARSISSLHLAHPHSIHLPNTRTPLPKQPRIRLKRPIRLPIQTPLAHAYILAYILHQRLLAHVIVLWPYKAQNDEAQRRAIEVLAERMQQVYLDGALGVFVVRIVAY